jgi:hypothetical protein
MKFYQSIVLMALLGYQSTTAITLKDLPDGVGLTQSRYEDDQMQADLEDAKSVLLDR